MNKEKTFPASLSELHSMMEWLRGWMRRGGLEGAELRKLELALEEAIVNIISYAYIDREGEIAIEAQLQAGLFLDFILSDSGQKFNPLSHEKIIDDSLPLEEIEEGGLGVMMMQKLVDQADYQYKDQKNLLRLRKNLSQKKRDAL